MKANYILTKRIFLITAFLLFAVTFKIHAASFTIDGINYTSSGLKLTVAKYSAGSPYSGEITIPEKITIDGMEYTVVATATNSFVDCKELTKVILPATCVTIGRKSFSGCSALANYPTPKTVTTIGQNAFDGCASITEAFIPAGCVTGGFNTLEFGGCTSLKKFTVEDSDKEFAMGPAMFGDVKPPLEELYLGRNVKVLYGAPFSKITTLKKITIGDNVTSLQASEFSGNTALTTVVIGSGSKLASIGTKAFDGCQSLQSVTIPAGVKEIPANTFYNCIKLESINWHDGIESIGDSAFGNDQSLSITSFPAGLKTIGKSAFRSSFINSPVILPEGLTSVGDFAFYKISTTKVELPSTVTNIGTAAFCISNNTGIKVADGNQAFKTIDDILYSFDGKTIYASAPKSSTLLATEAYNNADVTTIKGYAFSEIGFKSINMPALKIIGDRAFENAKLLESFTITGNQQIGSSVLTGSGIKAFTASEGVKELPLAICSGCTQLQTVTLPSSLTSIKREAFGGCLQLKNLSFEKNLNYIEDNSIPVSVDQIICKNPNVPIIGPNVFTPEMSGTTVKVASLSVDAYKGSQGWSYLNIVADPDISNEQVNIGCPAGLYFATKSGELMYKDIDGKIIDTGTTSGAHAFQLGAAHDRVYVGYAGERFTYSGTPDNEGEGEVFYLNKSGDAFYRVTLVSNIGYHAFQDIFSLTVDAEARKLLVADRNVGIHIIDTEKAGLFGEQPFFVQNNWLAYYGKGIAYGAIGSGLLKDSKGVYWMGKKFNGEGIFRFKESDIYPDGVIPADTPYEVLFQGTIMTTFLLDEQNGYFYAYLQRGTKNEKPGIYRISIADIEANQGSTYFATHGTLIDDSPVLMEGSDPSELTGVTQICSDGDNIYWSYIAPTSADQKYIGSVALDANNPLHKSGIKKISAKGEAAPSVKYSVENAEVYGVIAAGGYTETSGVESNMTGNKAGYVMRGKTIELLHDAQLRIFDIKGTLINEQNANAQSIISFEGLQSGMYIIHLNYTDGGNDVVKIIK